MSLFKAIAFKHWKQLSKDYIDKFFPRETSQLILTSQSADVSSTTLVTPEMSSVHRVSAHINVTTVASGGSPSSTMPPVTIGWTDCDSGQAQTKAITSSSSGNVLTTFDNGSVVVKSKGGVAITVSTSGYASSGTTAMKFALTVTVEAL